MTAGHEVTVVTVPEGQLPAEVSTGWVGSQLGCAVLCCRGGGRHGLGQLAPARPRRRRRVRGEGGRGPRDGAHRLGRGPHVHGLRVLLRGRHLHGGARHAAAPGRVSADQGRDVATCQAGLRVAALLEAEAAVRAPRPGAAQLRGCGLSDGGPARPRASGHCGVVRGHAAGPRRRRLAVPLRASVLPPGRGGHGEELCGLGAGHERRGLHVVPGRDLTADGQRLLGGDGRPAEPGEVGNGGLVISANHIKSLNKYLKWFNTQCVHY